MEDAGNRFLRRRQQAARLTHRPRFAHARDHACAAPVLSRLSHSFVFLPYTGPMSGLSSPLMTPQRPSDIEVHSSFSETVPARRFLAILAADVVGYARLTEAAEEATHLSLRALRFGVVNPCVVSFRGKIVKNTGDGFFASFESSYDAVRCAVAIQQQTAAAQGYQGHDRKIQFRMGLNVAETIVDSDDIFGQGVNIAARLEQIAPAGGI